MHKVLALVACLVIGYLIWSTVAALAYLGKADREATRTFAELQRVSAQTLEQQKTMEYHATKAYIEKVAREDMLMSKKGDTVILFPMAVSYTHLRAHETRHDLVCRLLLEK